MAKYTNKGKEKKRKGTAMGTACAPTHTNLFLGWWECTQVFVGDMEVFTTWIHLWVNFIDDVFIL